MSGKSPRAKESVNVLPRSELRSPLSDRFILPEWLRTAHAPNQPDIQAVSKARQNIFDGSIQYFRHLREIDGLKAIRDLLARTDLKPGEIYRTFIDQSGVYDWRDSTKGRKQHWKVGPGKDDYGSFRDHHEWIFEAMMQMRKGDFAGLLSRFEFPTFQDEPHYHYVSSVLSFVSKIPVIRRVIPWCYSLLSHPFVEPYVIYSLRFSLLANAAVNMLGLATLKIDFLDRLSPHDLKILELAISVHDYGKVATMDAQHPRIGGLLVPHLLRAINAPDDVLSSQDIGLLAALTEHEFDFGPMMFGESSPAYLLEKLKAEAVDANKFLSLMALVFIFDAGSVPRSSIYPDHFTDVNGAMIPNKGALSYGTIKNAIYMARERNLRVLATDWAKRRFVGFYQPGNDVMLMGNPIRHYPVGVERAVEVIEGANVSAKRFINKAAFPDIFNLRYMTRISSGALPKWFYLLSTIKQIDEIDIVDIFNKSPDELDSILRFLSTLPDVPEMSETGWSMSVPELASSGSVLTVQDQSGVPAASVRVSFNSTLKVLEIHAATWKEGRQELRGNSNPDDQLLMAAQAQYERERDDRRQGGAFGMQQNGPYFGLHKERYMLNQAFIDPRFYYDAACVYVDHADLSTTAAMLESAKGSSIPRYTFVYRSDERIEDVRARLTKEQAAAGSVRLVPILVISGDVPGTLNGALWSRKMFKESLKNLGYSWESLKIKPIFLVWGTGVRSFPMRRANKIISPSPISDMPYLLQNFQATLQYISPNMKLSSQPGHNFVIYPDSNKYLDGDIGFARRDSPAALDAGFIGSEVPWDDKHLSDLGIANLDAEGALVDFVEKPNGASEIDIRLGSSGKQAVKFRSFGDFWGTDQFFDMAEDLFWEFVIDPTGIESKIGLDFAMHLGEAWTIRQNESVAGRPGRGMTLDEWLSKKIDATERSHKLAILKKNEILRDSLRFRLGGLSGGIESRFVHSNSMEANHDMQQQLVGDPFIRELAGIIPSSRYGGAIIGPNVILGPDVVVEPGAVILGHTIIKNGIVESGAVIKDSWLGYVHAHRNSNLYDVDERSGYLNAPSGYYVNDVYIRVPGAAGIKKVRHSRRINENINEPVYIDTILLNTGAFHRGDGTIDPLVFETLNKNLRVPNYPKIAIISHLGFDQVVQDYINLIDSDLRHKVMVYAENGASVRGFNGNGSPTGAFYNFTFPNISEVRQVLNDAVHRHAVHPVPLHGSGAFISIDFQTVEDLENVAKALHEISLNSSFKFFLSIHIENEIKQLRVSLVDRSLVIEDLVKRLDLNNKPNHRIFIIVTTGQDHVIGGVTEDDRKGIRIRSQNAGLTDAAVEHGRADKVLILSTTATPLLNIAVDRPLEGANSTATRESLNLILDNVSKPTSYRHWPINGNRFNLQQLSQFYDRSGIVNYLEELKAEVAKTRQELRQSVQRDEAVMDFMRALREHRFSGSPRSFFIADYDEALTHDAIQKTLNELPQKSDLVLLVNKSQIEEIETNLKERITVPNSKRVLLAGLDAQQVVGTLISSSASAVIEADIFHLRSDSQVLRDARNYQKLWQVSESIMKPGRIVVFSVQKLDFKTAHTLSINSENINLIVSAIFDQMSTEQAVLASA